MCLKKLVPNPKNNRISTHPLSNTQNFNQRQPLTVTECATMIIGPCTALPPCRADHPV